MWRFEKDRKILNKEYQGRWVLYFIYVVSCCCCFSFLFCVLFTLLWRVMVNGHHDRKYAM
jgi:hypothetical protein